MKVPALVAIAMVALSIAPVLAQSQVESSVRTAGDLGLKIPVIAWTAGVALDQVTTYRFSSQYGDLLHERNPLVRGLDQHPGLLVAAGTSIDAATGWATYQLLGRRHPRLARILFYGATAYRVYLASYNIRMMQRADQVRAIASHSTTSP